MSDSDNDRLAQKLSTISTRGLQPERLNLVARQKTGLPFVSWESGALHRDEQERMARFDYPSREPVNPEKRLSSDPKIMARAYLKAISSLIRLGVAEALKTRRQDLVTKCVDTATAHPRAHLGLTRPFYSWPILDAKLCRLASLVFDPEAHDCVHLVEPEECDLRFSQGGDGLVGLDPRLVAWRSWLNYEYGELPAFDLLMGVRHFGWYVLQHPVHYSQVILGGTHLREEERRLVYAERSAQGWRICPLKEHLPNAAIMLMS